MAKLNHEMKINLNLPLGKGVYYTIKRGKYNCYYISK